jgi:hypothetical protein
VVVLLAGCSTTATLDVPYPKITARLRALCAEQNGALSKDAAERPFPAWRSAGTSEDEAGRAFHLRLERPVERASGRKFESWFDRAAVTASPRDGGTRVEVGVHRHHKRFLTEERERRRGDERELLATVLRHLRGAD